MIWLHITLLEGISLEQIGFMFCFSLRWELILTRRTSLRTTRCRCLGRSPFPLGVSQVWTQNVNGLCCLYKNCHFGFIFLDKPTNHLVGIVFVILHGFPWIVEAISTFYWLDDLSFFERSSPHRMCLNGGARVCGELKKTTHSLLKGWNVFFLVGDFKIFLVPGASHIISYYHVGWTKPDWCWNQLYTWYSFVQPSFCCFAHSLLIFIGLNYIYNGLKSTVGWWFCGLLFCPLFSIHLGLGMPMETNHWGDFFKMI